MSLYFTKKNHQTSPKPNRKPPRANQLSQSASTLPPMQESISRSAFPTNLLGRGISLAELVEWKIQAERKQRRPKESMILQRLQEDSAWDFEFAKAKPNMYIRTNFPTKHLLSEH